MRGFGTVIGGAYINGSVTTATFGSGLVVAAGFKRRPMTPETISSWQEIPIEAKDSTFTAMGKAAAGVALPGRFGKAASAAVGAAFDSKKPERRVRIDWADGQKSLLKLPDDLYTHFALVLNNIRIPTEAPDPGREVASADGPLTITDKAFDLVAGLVNNRWPGKTPASDPASELGAQPIVAALPAVDFHGQLVKLASLRDAGILTDEEFATKKAELLARM